MIICPVCGSENDSLATVCVSCRSFVQGKVDALNLFSTIWGLMESPVATLRTVLLSRHKNYALTLAWLSGTFGVLWLVWLRSDGFRFPDVFTLLAVSAVAGAILGPLVVAVVAVAARVLIARWKVRARFRDLFALLSYAAVPLVLSLACVVPADVAVFGQYFFASNPPPISISGPAYVGLMTLHTAAIVYSVWLVWLGTSALSVGGVARRFALAGMIIGIPAVLSFAITRIPV